jgi:hypothetical protein
LIVGEDVPNEHKPTLDAEIVFNFLHAAVFIPGSTNELSRTATNLAGFAI